MLFIINYYFEKCYLHASSLGLLTFPSFQRVRDLNCKFHFFFLNLTDCSAIYFPYP